MKPAGNDSRVYNTRGYKYSLDTPDDERKRVEVSSNPTMKPAGNDSRV